MLARKRRFAASVPGSAQNRSLDAVSPTVNGVIEAVPDGNGPFGVRQESGVAEPVSGSTRPSASLIRPSAIARMASGIASHSAAKTRAARRDVQTLGEGSQTLPGKARR